MSERKEKREAAVLAAELDATNNAARATSAPFGPADFSGSEEPTRPAVPHPSIRPEAPEAKHYDATCGARFSVKQTNVEAIMHQLHQLIDDSFHAVDVGLLPAGCRITIIVEP